MNEREALVKRVSVIEDEIASGRMSAMQVFTQMRQLISALTQPEAQGEPVAHSDDLAVDRFAAAMKKKLAQKRDEGRSGWDDPKQCSITLLENMLHEHYQKGDVIDLANFCMMLHQRGMPTRWRLTPPAVQYKASHYHMHDLYVALGIKWGDDPFTVIQRLRNPAAPQSGVRAGMLRAAEIVKQGLIPLSDYLKIQNHVVKRDVDREQGLLNSLAAAITRAADQVNERQLETVQVRDYKELYLDLIMQVGKYHPGESRHDTAKRYIVNAETCGDDRAAQEAK